MIPDLSLSSADVEKYVSLPQLKQQYPLVPWYPLLQGEYYQLVWFSDWERNLYALARNKENLKKLFLRRSRPNRTDYHRTLVSIEKVLVGKPEERFQEIHALKTLNYFVESMLSELAYMFRQQLGKTKQRRTKLFKFCDCLINPEWSYGCETCNHSGVRFLGTTSDLMFLYFETYQNKIKPLLLESDPRRKRVEQQEKQKQQNQKLYRNNCPILTEEFWSASPEGSLPRHCSLPKEENSGRLWIPEGQYYYQVLETVESSPELLSFKQDIETELKKHDEKQEEVYKTQEQNRTNNYLKEEIRSRKLAAKVFSLL